MKKFLLSILLPCLAGSCVFAQQNQPTPELIGIVSVPDYERAILKLRPGRFGLDEELFVSNGSVIRESVANRSDPILEVTGIVPENETVKVHLSKTDQVVTLKLNGGTGGKTNFPGLRLRNV